MQELIRLNFIDMVHRYDKHQKVKRIEAVTLTKQRLADKFLKLYRIYRHKKFGEPYDPNNLRSTDNMYGLGFGTYGYLPKQIQEQEHEIYQKIEAL